MKMEKDWKNRGIWCHAWRRRIAKNSMRGSRPGERRGGRQKGTPNKKTALTRAAVAASAANENLSPLELMLAIMRDPHVGLVTRVKMALRALPLLHTKLKAIPSGSSGLGHNDAAVPSSDGTKKSNSGSRKSAPATHGNAQTEAVNKRAAAPSADQPIDSHEGSPTRQSQQRTGDKWPSNHRGAR